LRAPGFWPEAVFLGVIFSDDADKARAWLRTEGATYPHLVDPGGRVAIDYGVAGVPETFFIAPDGRIAHKQVGPVDERVLTALLGKPR
jgi:cytochrome c biogenesis protein CcmG/thiol:disulfide interchange protein DsbE